MSSAQATTSAPGVGVVVEGWAAGVPRQTMSSGRAATAPLLDTADQTGAMGRTLAEVRAEAMATRAHVLQRKMDARDRTARAFPASPPGTGSLPTSAMSTGLLGQSQGFATMQSLRESVRSSRTAGSASLRPPPDATGLSTSLRSTGVAGQPPQWDAYGPATSLAGATAVPRRLDSRSDWTTRHPLDASVVADREATRRALATALVPGLTGQVRGALPEGWGKTDKIARAGVSDEMVRYRRPASDSFRPPYWNVTMRDHPEAPVEARWARAAAATTPDEDRAAAAGAAEGALRQRPLAPVLPTGDAPFLPQFDVRARQMPHGRPATLHRDAWGMHRMPRPGPTPAADGERLAERAVALRKMVTAEKEGILQAKLKAAQMRALSAAAAGAAHDPTVLQRARLAPPAPSLVCTGRTMPFPNGNRLPLQSNLYEPTATRGLVIPAARTLYTKC